MERVEGTLRSGGLRACRVCTCLNSGMKAEESVETELKA